MILTTTHKFCPYLDIKSIRQSRVVTKLLYDGKTKKNRSIKKIPMHNQHQSEAGTRDASPNLRFNLTNFITATYNCQKYSVLSVFCTTMYIYRVQNKISHSIQYLLQVIAISKWNAPPNAYQYSTFILVLHRFLFYSTQITYMCWCLIQHVLIALF